MDREQGFEEFKSGEIDVGLDHAARTKGIRLTREVMRVAGNHAGAIRKAQRVTPRVAVVQALRAYEKRNNLDISHDRYEAYIAGIAKMLSERNPATARKRRTEREVAEIKAVA